jgi:hypothetical protein
LPSSAPSLGELTLQAKQNLQAPWLGFTAFFTFAIMLSLLVFIFEGVRDAFDPQKDLSMSDACWTSATCRSPSGRMGAQSMPCAACRSMWSGAKRSRWWANPGRASRSRRLPPWASARQRAGDGVGPLSTGRDDRRERAVLRGVRGNDISFIFQEPMTSLNPLHTIERQIGESLALHQGLSGAKARARMI